MLGALVGGVAEALTRAGASEVAAVRTAGRARSVIGLSVSGHPPAATSAQAVSRVTRLVRPSRLNSCPAEHAVSAVPNAGRAGLGDRTRPGALAGGSITRPAVVAPASKRASVT